MKTPGLAWRLLLLLVMLTTAGCSGGSPAGGTAPTPTASNLTSGTAWVYGQVDIGGESVEGATVAVMADTQGGVALAGATVRKGGVFSVRVNPLLPGGAFAVKVTTRTGEVFGTAVASLRNAADPGGRGVFVHVNTLTTLCLAYRARHPELTVADAMWRVHRFVRLPVRYDMGDELAPYKYSRFHQPKFMQRARAYGGGLSAWATRVATLIDDPPASLDEYANYNNDEDFGDDELPAMNSVSTSMQEPAKTADAETQAAFTTANDAGDSGLDPMLGILKAGLTFITETAHRNELTAALTEMQSQLNFIKNMLNTLEGQITAAFNQTNYNVLASALASPIIANLNTGVQVVANINQAANQQPTPDLTNLNGYAMGLNGVGSDALSFRLSDVYTYAQTIHTYEMQGDSGITALLTLASQISGVAYLIGPPQLTAFQNHVNYYVGQQVNAAALINAMSAPVMLTGTPPYTYNFGGTSSPAFAANNATNMVTSGSQNQYTPIYNNVQQEMAVLPYPLFGSQPLIYDPQNNNLWYAVSTPYDDTSDYESWIESMNIGGLRGVWKVAAAADIQHLYQQAKAANNNSTPSSYSAVLNRFGFDLTPGVVSISEQINTWGIGWEKCGTQTYTEHGYLTIEFTTDGYNIGWIDDQGNTGTIGSYVGSASLSEVLGSERDIVVGYQTNGQVCGGKVQGAMIPVVNLGSNPDMLGAQTPSFAFVPLGQYNGINVQAGATTADTLSNSSSYTQPLTAIPNGTNGASVYASSYPITNEVFWTSSDPTDAPISNLVPAPAPTTPVGPPANISNAATMSGAYYNQDFANYPPTLANDGNVQTYWQGPFNTNPTSLTAAFASPYLISTMNVVLPPQADWTTRSQTITVLGSNDNTHWTTLVPQASYTFAPNGAQGANNNTITIPVNSASAYQYMQLSFASNSIQSGMGGQVAEWQIFGWSPPTVVITPANIGNIHWLPTSAGKQVTFTASRYLPNGTQVNGTVKLTSPVQPNPANPTPDTIQVWPSVFNIHPADLQSGSLKLFVSRHYGSGTFQDVATQVGQGGTNVNYASSDANVSVSTYGTVSSTVAIPIGTTITITITDPTVPASTTTIPTRPSVTATIHVISP